MKLLKKNISAKDGSGTVLLRAETSEDLWHAYNLLQVGDLVRTTTLRKVTKESATGSVTSNKVRMSLTIEVLQVDFDSESLEVRIAGKNREESDFVKLGAHHTLTLELERNFSINKAVWDQIFLDRLDDAIHPENDAEIAAVVMQLGLAHVCMVTGSLTIVKAKVDVNIPKKRTGSSNHSKAITRFFEAVYQAILRHIDLEQIKCCLVASPGYVKDDFFRYLQEQSTRRDDRILQQKKSKFVLCKASSGHLHALEEVFSDPAIMSRMNDTKVAREVQVLNEFMRMIDSNPDRAAYGYGHVFYCNDQMAIDSLLVTDELFRSSDVVTRKKYVELVESVRGNGGKVYLFSSLHVSGKQLQQVSGVAAILRYPIPNLEDIEQDAMGTEDDAQDEDFLNDDYDDDDDEEEEEDQESRKLAAEEGRIQEDMEDLGLA